MIGVRVAYVWCMFGVLLVWMGVSWVVFLRYVGCVVACWFVCLWFAWLCVGHVCGDACGIVGLCLVCFLILSVLCFVNVCA